MIKAAWMIVRACLRLTAGLATLASTAGCATVQNTPTQDYVWAMWKSARSLGCTRVSIMSSASSQMACIS